MDNVLAGIFRREKDLDGFFRALAPLDGGFELDAREMTALGEAYFERYPDRQFDRNMDEIRIGYSLARICIIEKAVTGLDPAVKDVFRRMFSEPSSVEVAIGEMAGSRGCPAVAACVRAVGASLQASKDVIDELPRGMIKERFLGGISGLFNVMYLVRMFLGRLAPDCLQSP